jgi:ribosomal protein S27E
MRAGERYSSQKPELPAFFKIVCPKCGKRQMVLRASTYFVDVDSPAVTLTDIL